MHSEDQEADVEQAHSSTFSSINDSQKSPRRLTLATPTPLTDPLVIVFIAKRSLVVEELSCRFRVFFAGAEAYCDTTEVFCMSAPTAESGGWTYGSNFLPRFWDDLTHRIGWSYY